MLFKVLGPNGDACHGGNGSWPLPTAKKPGAWHEVKETPKVCEKGLHLVSRPLRWWKKQARLFVAEADLTAPTSFDGSEKAAFQRARLLYEVTADWLLLPMFPDVRLFLAMTARSNDDEDTFKKLLSGANLRGADLHGANLSGANLRGADLSGADLYGADLYGAYLSGANLRGAYLSGAYLHGANLSGADLHGAYLHGANLYGADLSGANLSGADLHGAYLSGAYRPEDPPDGWEANEDGLLVKKEPVATSKRKMRHEETVHSTPT